MVNIAVLGYGIVGSGVVELVSRNRTSIGRKTGNEIVVKKILDIRDFPGDPNKGLFSRDPEDVFGDPSIRIIVETIGGIKAAHDFTRKAFETGRHVVTSNKELIAAHGPELLELSSSKGLSYLFEGSVGGGIPIIRPLNQCLAANEITGIAGILNGTTNFILSKMKREGLDFSTALKSAQDNGYAEADPSADIEGHDACRKIAILSSIAYGEYVDYRSIHTEGITGVSAADIEYASAIGCVIKLIARSSKSGDMVHARVSPVMIPGNHALANVEDVFNAIIVRGDAIGDAMFYGRGAGKFPTASAIVADIIDIVNHEHRYERIKWEKKPYNNVADPDSDVTAFYVRTSVRNVNEAKRHITGVFGTVDFISLNKPGYGDDVAFITQPVIERDFSLKVEKLKNIGSIRDVMSVIRIDRDVT